MGITKDTFEGILLTANQLDDEVREAIAKRPGGAAFLDDEGNEATLGIAAVVAVAYERGARDQRESRYLASNDGRALDLVAMSGIIREGAGTMEAHLQTCEDCRARATEGASNVVVTHDRTVN